MTDEVINIDLKSIDEKKSREERKANGRYAAVIIALIIIILAIYHAWIRKTAVLAGILVPALIMILYGGWVIFLTKRDKKRRLLLARQMEENARLEIAEQIAAATAIKNKINEKRKNSPSKTMTTLPPTKTTPTMTTTTISNEFINNKIFDKTTIIPSDTIINISNNDDDGINNKHNNNNNNYGNIEKHKKRKHKKRTRPNATSGGNSKRPSFRDRFISSKRKNNKNLQLPPYLCRTNSAP